MRFQATASGVLFGAPHKGRYSSIYLYIINSLYLTAAFIIGLGLHPSSAEAAKQKAVRKDSSKAKVAPATAPARGFTNAQPPRGLLRQPPAAPPIDLAERREHVVYKARTGETFAKLLARTSLPPSERQTWERAVRSNLGNRPLPIGKEIHLYLSHPVLRLRRQPHAQLKAIEIDDHEASTLTWEKGLRGIFFQRREKPFDVELKTISGVVQESIFEDGRKGGIHSTLLSQLADIFTWDIDLEKEIRKGDSFKILYEQKSRRGPNAKTALRILAAELNNSGQKLTAIYFEKDQGQGNYYNSEGRSLARSFLRFPLEFTAITSHFTESRFHPILKTNLPHNGVDFAAQRGTPVRAVGDGIILEAGWNGRYGKAIELKHDYSTYLSRYAHLDSFAEGIHPGVSVSKGQLIGYVGSTGRSTGPHLHFELYKDQQYVNPLSVEFPADESIEPALKKIFENQMRTYLVELTAVPQADLSAPSAFLR